MEVERVILTAVLAGKILIESNCEAYRVEETVSHIINKHPNLEASAIALTTGLYVSIQKKDQHFFTIVKRVNDRSTNLNNIHVINDLSRAYINDQITIDQMNKVLEDLVKKQQYSLWATWLSMVIGVSAFLLLSQGNSFELLINIPLALLVTFLLTFLPRYGMHNFMVNLTTCFVVACSVTLLAHTFPLVSDNRLIVANILPMVPGTAITNGIRDIFKGDYMSGTAKLLEAMMIGIFIAVGIALGLVFGGLWI